MFCSYYKLFYFSINCLQRSFLHHFRYATPTIPSCPLLTTHSTIIFVFSSNNNTILFTIFNITIFFAMLGMLSPASRGALLTASIFLYEFMGLVSGYYAGTKMQDLFLESGYQTKTNLDLFLA